MSFFRLHNPFDLQFFFNVYFKKVRNVFAHHYDYFLTLELEQGYRLHNLLHQKQHQIGSLI